MVYSATGGSGGGGYGAINKASVFKKKPAVTAPRGPTLPKYSQGAKSTPRPMVRAVPRSGSGGRSNNNPSSRGSSSRGSGGGGNNSSRGRSGNGYSGGGGVGSTSSGSIAPVKPIAPPKPPSLSSFLGTDSTYVQQKSALEKAKADYLAQQNEQKTNYMTGYATDQDTLGKNRTAALGDLENDFASRGLMQSGLYADSLSTANNDWDKRGSALEQAKAQFLRQMTGDFSNFSQEQLLTLQRAEQEAAARRAGQYGI